ncbi:uncharacterized protein BDR25DRAFT_341027 [Lindgomyces ingoldianus]|uniref:Uncharacterized protein n=1 Tax=Lindgomyces ingoldianus TaxID=673940 RepID=A0ACB6R5D3_9PLEO|nr:uncharacterized protein BDR25DRAFT_341027 [Lindgomyces ingoldianus]KAF2473742.1 hypothetical protein BDR25DRAFT_341027 [Lindgomyces ingoldianus]
MRQSYQLCDWAYRKAEFCHKADFGVSSEDRSRISDLELIFRPTLNLEFINEGIKKILSLNSFVMVFGRSTKANLPPVSVSDVRKEYDTRIEQFLDGVGESSSRGFWSKEEPLQALFDWALRVRAKQRKTEQKLTEQTQAYNEQVDAYKRMEKNRQGLLKAKAELEGKHSKALSELHSIKRNHQDEIETLTLQHSTSMGDLETKMRDQRIAWETAFESQKQQNEQAIKRLMREHKREVDNMQNNYTVETQTLLSDHKAETTTMRERHEAERDRLIGQLLVNQDDSQEWPDDKLKARFLEMHRLVDSIASPQRQEFRFPADANIDSDLDPNGFFQRNKRGKGHYLVKSVIWGILQDHFFGMPFGFGAFGPGNVHEELLAAFNNWRRLCQGGENSDPIGSSDLNIFEVDRLANRWRTTTFQGVSHIGNEDTGDSHSTTYKLMAKNRETSKAQIVNYLSAVAALSQNIVKPDVEEEIRQTTRQAEEIALQFGIHSSKLLLLSPDHAWSGDPAPGLLKFTPGKENGVSRQTIVHCKGSPDR